MSIEYFTSEQLSVLRRELDKECAEYEREHGPLTAAQRNQMAARLMESARNGLPLVPASAIIDPRGT